MKRKGLRDLAPEERETLERLARSRTESARAVERAQIVWLASRGESTADIASRLRVGPATVRAWVRRFNEAGMAGFADRQRSGAPRRYSAAQVAEVLDVAARAPPTLGLPFERWTLTRLQSYLNQQRGISVRRSRISEILQKGEVAESFETPRLFARWEPGDSPVRKGGRRTR